MHKWYGSTLDINNTLFYNFIVDWFIFVFTKKILNRRCNMYSFKCLDHQCYNLKILKLRRYFFKTQSCNV